MILWIVFVVIRQVLFFKLWFYLNYFGGMMSIFLTRDEVVDLTGRIRYAAQVKVLNSMHIPFLLNAASRPIVARATVERILGVTSNAIAQPEKSRWKSAKTKD